MSRPIAEIEGETVAEIRASAKRRIMSRLYGLLATGLTQTQAAEHMGITPSAVSQLLSKARRLNHGEVL